jgi:hypothetical protein
VRVCLWHLAKLGEDPIQLADLYDEIGLRLAGSASAGEKTSGTRNPGLALDDRAVEMRDEIKAVLTSWASMICEERGWTPPADDIVHVAAVVVRAAPWLAAHGAAADASSELRDLVRRAYSVAYPSGSRVFEVAGCPMHAFVGEARHCLRCGHPAEHGMHVQHDCDGKIRAIVRRTDSLLPSSLECDTDESHTWPADRWLTLGRELRKKEAA